MNDRCVRCGRVVPWGQSVCRACNPAGLPSPSSSQFHATVFVAVIGALLLMAVAIVIHG